MDTNVGIFYNVPFKEYREWEALSKSAVPHINRSGIHYKAYREKKIKKTKSMELGSLVDCLLLEPELFDKQYFLAPKTVVTDKGVEKEWSLRLAVCREIKARKESFGMTMISNSDYELAQKIANRVKANKTATELLEGKRQVSIRWIDSTTGILCKARLDVLAENSINDLKTTKNASPAVFPSEMKKYEYYVQGYVYTHAYEQVTGEMLGFNVFAVESSEPFGVCSYSIMEDSLLLGKKEWDKACLNYKDYIENGASDYEEGLHLVDVPAWALKPIYEGEREELIIQIK